VAVYI